jgi:hypothetical protein
MMDLRTLQHVNRQLTQRAAREKRVPVLITPEDVDAYSMGAHSAISIPFVGERTPRGYRRVDEPVFVDKSGFGSEDEPAWTLRRFLEHVKACGASYWASVEEGQFQIYVQRFERVQ